MKIAIIPARGGSTRIPGKNKRMFHGKPIICYSIDTAKATGLFNQIIVSTDDPEIAAIAIARGALAVYRDADYCKNEVGTQDVISNCVKQITPMLQAQMGFTCGIYPTSPLMRPDDIQRGFRQLQENDKMNYAMSVGADPLRDAGQFYFGKTIAFYDRKPLLTAHTIMIPISENNICDINTEDDFLRAEQMYEVLHHRAG